MGIFDDDFDDDFKKRIKKLNAHMVKKNMTYEYAHELIDNNPFILSDYEGYKLEYNGGNYLLLKNDMDTIMIISQSKKTKAAEYQLTVKDELLGMEYKTIKDDDFTKITALTKKVEQLHYYISGDYTDMIFNDKDR